MSWAAHQFEIYAVQAHLPKKMRGKVSFFGIFLGDFTPDFLSKFWVYGITIGGHHYGADSPHQWHRGWPGMGFTHTMFLGVLIGAALWAVEAEPRPHRRLHPRLRRPRAHRRERQRGDDAAVPVHHAELDVGDLGVRRDARTAASTSTRRRTTAASAWSWTCSGSSSSSSRGASSPASTGAPRSCRPTRTSGRGSASACPSAPCSRSTGPRSSTGCAACSPGPGGPTCSPGRSSTA